MTDDAVTAERQRLFELGGMTLIRMPSGIGRMVATVDDDCDAHARANRYNELAAGERPLAHDPRIYVENQLRGVRDRRSAYPRLVQMTAF